MKYFLLQTSCEHKSLSSPELPQYLSTAKSSSIQKHLHMCWHRRTTIQRSDDSNMSQIAPSVIYRSHAWLLCSLICIWVPEVSPSHRKQLIVWVCAAYTNWGERYIKYMLLWLCMSAVWTPIEMKPQEINACDQCGIVIVHWDTATPLLCPRTLEKGNQASVLW